MFETGRNELIVGRGAAAQFAGSTSGGRSRSGQNEWTVVGIFDAGGTVSDSELWCDAGVLQPAYRRGNIVPDRVREARVGRGVHDGSRTR